jgi:hypothetical protein
VTRLGSVIEVTGFGNGKGELAFNKLVTFTALWFFGVTLYAIVVELRQVPPWYVWSFGFGVVGAGFGLKGYLGAAARRTEAMQQTDTTNVTVNAADVIRAASDAIAKRRDTAKGIDPA